jgi:uncharacterized repeat protein (TIGR01451 family)
MSHTDLVEAAGANWPRWWRMFLIGACTLILCSCRAPSRPGCESSCLEQSAGSAGLPPEAYTGVPPAGVCPPPMGPPGMEQGVPLPYAPVGPWAPPGIAGPWPEDEYICDGGDAGLPARVGKQGAILGLEVEDAVAQYDTLDGRTVVEPSNRVCIYSPRFGAVRQVVSLVCDEQLDRSAGFSGPTKLARCDESLPVLSTKQNVQADDKIAARPPVVMRSKQDSGAMSSALGPWGFQDALKPYENLAIIRDGMMQSSEMAHLARGANAAIAWTHKQAVEVILDHQAAAADTGYEKLQSVFTVETPNHPRLRIEKVASTPFAEPGDEVSFTLRFDNTGDQVIGNVTILDNLSGRLEYVPQSAQCSLKAQFFTGPNEADSLVVRCEVTDPLPPGKGGVVRFTCKVR